MLVYLDDNDPQLVHYQAIPNVVYKIGPRVGYAKLHEPIGHILVPAAQGEWLFLWNDDAVMTTRQWDYELSIRPRECVLAPTHNHFGNDKTLNVFPIVPKKWVDLVGWAKNGANDTWWQVVADMIRRSMPVPIHIHHLRSDLTGDHKDQTRAENNYDSSTFWTTQNYALMGFAAGRIYQQFYQR